jgi:hypothetical protein
MLARSRNAPLAKGVAIGTPGCPARTVGKCHVSTAASTVEVIIQPSTGTAPKVSSSPSSRIRLISSRRSITISRSSASVVAAIVGMARAMAVFPQSIRLPRAACQRQVPRIAPSPIHPTIPQTAPPAAFDATEI